MLEAVEKLVGPLVAELTAKVADVCPKFSLDELKKRIEPVACELQAKVIAAAVSGKDISDEVLPAVTAVVSDFIGDFKNEDEIDGEDDL